MLMMTSEFKEFHKLRPDNGAKLSYNHTKEGVLLDMPTKLVQGIIGMHACNANKEGTHMLTITEFVI